MTQLSLSTSDDLKQYGALVKGSGYDDTALAQQAINDLATTGGRIRLVGQLHISTLNVTQKKGLTIEGDGIMATEILPIASTNSILDLSGSFAITLRDFKLGASNQTVTPKAAILTLQTQNAAGNLLRFHDIFVDGMYENAAWYNYGYASSYFSGMCLWNYRDAAAKSYAMYLGADNAHGMISPYLPATGGYSLATTGFDLKDLTFSGCEIHAMKAGGGPANNSAIRMRGARKVGFVGGNISGTGNELIELQSVGAVNCKKVMFSTVEFYGEIGPLPNYIFTNGTVEGLIVHGCEENGIAFASAPGSISGLSHI